jgi:hypothetical protein
VKRPRHGSGLIDRKLLSRFVKLAADRLEGRWVLLGGTLLPLLGIEYRVTTDIDVAGLDRADQAQTLELMEIAAELGLPVESINQAAAYFLMKLKPFEDHLILLHRGKQAEILRPDLHLFLMLKAGRLSPSDLTDCLALIKKEGPLSSRDSKSIRAWIAAEIKKAGSSERAARLKVLAEKL